MHADDIQETIDYRVVVNHEEQYSIWPAHRDIPAGWKDAGKSGRKDECLDYIKEVWTDMRPLSLRKQMEENEKEREGPGVAVAGADAQELVDDEPGAVGETEDDLVDRLCEGDHPVEASLRSDRTVQRFKECIERGYVQIKFTDTRGGTEIGVRLDEEAIDLSKADFEQETGSVHLEGDLTLNFVEVRCIVDVDLDTLAGQGHLERVEPGS